MAGAGAVASAGAGASLPLQWPLVGRHETLEVFTAALADPRAHGLVLHGAPGVGKTRLADQCLALADRAGRNVARATATEGSRAVPLGALAPILPPGATDERGDLVGVMAQVRAVLRDQADRGPLVLFVDDLHLLDPTSATLVGQLVDADLVFLVATVRTDARVAPGLDALWQRARVRRIDLHDLDRAAVDTLLHLVLQGPVEASTISEIWTASQGNVLFVRELVLGAVERGHLVHQRGVWRLAGPLVTTARLGELLAARWAALGAPAIEALELLAVLEPAGLSVVEALVGGDRLEALDRAGLLLVTSDGRRQHVTLAHPLHGEILRARVPALARRRLLLEHADRIEGWGARRRNDAVGVATSRLEASGSADPRLLVRAARLARHGHDFTQVERLGRAALQGGVTPEVALLVGEALHELGSFTEADEVLAAAAGAADLAIELIVPLAEIRSRNLLWGLGRPDEALEVSGAARRLLAERGGAGDEELTAHEAVLLSAAGRPLDALARLEVLPEVVGRRVGTLRALAEAPALVAVGRCDAGAERARAGFAQHMELDDQIAIPGPGAHLVTQTQALAEAGQLVAAAALAAAVYEATPATAPPEVLLWLSHQLGRCALLSGHAMTARRWLGEALARCEQHHLVAPSRLVLSALATAHAYQGDAVAAAAAVDELDRLPPSPLAPGEQELGRAWAKVVAGDRPGGREVLRAAAEVAAGLGYRTGEAWLLHDVARLGEPGSVVARLEELAGSCEGQLVATYALHAGAAAGGRASALVDVADRFERHGALLLAAEAATEAAQAFQRAGDGRAAAALGLRASALAGSCEGARTPGLTAAVMVAPLTRRERDIATLAARGESSREIAERLFLSVRTVNNHLQNVYAKLGVSGRRQLAGALADQPEPA